MYAKAIVGGLTAGLTAAQAALLTPGITSAEWVTIALAVLGTGSVVWVTTNQTDGTRPINVTVSRPTTGGMSQGGPIHTPGADP